MSIKCERLPVEPRPSQPVANKINFRVYTIGLGLGLYGLSYRVDHTVYVDTDVATATMKPVLNYRIRLLLIVIDWCLLNGK